MDSIRKTNKRVSQSVSAFLISHLQTGKAAPPAASFSMWVIFGENGKSKFSMLIKHNFWWKIPPTLRSEISFINTKATQTKLR